MNRLIRKSEFFQAMRFEADSSDWREMFGLLRGRPQPVFWFFYNKYLESVAWCKKRMARLAIDNNTCPECGRTKDFTRLQVHHLHYRNVGDEDVSDDLRTLCWICHAAEHGKLHDLNLNDAETISDFCRLVLLDPERIPERLAAVEVDMYA